MDCIKVAKYSGTVQGRSRMNFDTALERGLVHFAGMEKTKTGSGDKDVAYIVRQNCFLRIFFYLVVFGTVCAVFIFSTKLRIEIIERDVIDEEIKHRKSEHGVQLKLVSALLEQKQSMEEQIGFVNKIEEFRSTMMKELGTYASSISAEFGKLEGETGVRLNRKFAETVERLEHSLEGIIGPFQENAELSKQRLAKLQRDIIQEVKEDEEELQFYIKKLEQYGISKKSAARFESQKYETLSGGSDSAERSHIADIEQESADSERNMEHALEELFAKVRANKFPKMRRMALQKLEKFEHDVLKELQDKGKEVDVDIIAKSFNKLLMRHAPEVNGFERKDGVSAVEFVKQRVRDARIAMNRDRLMELYDDWKVKKKLSTFQVLSEVESLLALEETSGLML